MLDTQEFKPKARGFLIEQAVALADHYIDGYERPDTALYEEVETFLSSIESEFSERTEQETSAQIDYYLNQISTDAFYAGEDDSEELKVVYENYVAVPEGGVAGNEFLTKNVEGDLVWGAPKSTSKVAEELSSKDGQLRIKPLNGKWQQSTDGGASYSEIGSGTQQEGEQPSLINDDVASQTTTFSSTKEIELLGKKVDKVEGKGLSKNDFNNTAKNKVDKINISGTGAKVWTDNGEYLTYDQFRAKVSPIDSEETYAYTKTYPTYTDLLIDDSPVKEGTLVRVDNATDDPRFPIVGSIKWGIYQKDSGVDQWDITVVGDKVTRVVNSLEPTGTFDY